LCGLNWQVETFASGTGCGEEWLEVVEGPVFGDGTGGFGTAPEVEAYGDDGTVLGGDSVEDVDEAGAAEVLALGRLTFGVGIAAG
jgi:hypothetical protein